MQCVPAVVLVLSIVAGRFSGLGIANIHYGKQEIIVATIRCDIPCDNSVGI